MFITFACQIDCVGVYLCLWFVICIFLIGVPVLVGLRCLSLDCCLFYVCCSSFVLSVVALRLAPDLRLDARRGYFVYGCACDLSCCYYVDFCLGLTLVGLLLCC